MRYNRFFNRLFLLPAVILLFTACKKTEALSSAADITSYTITGQNPQVNIDNTLVTVQLAETVTSGQNLVASFNLSPGAHASIGSAEQVSGVTQNDFDSDLVYTVTAADQTLKTWTVRATNNNYSYAWGLGRFVKESYSNERNYEWYIDQYNSGAYNLINCGPTSVTMAIKWSDPAFTGTPEQARQTYRSSGGWWLTSDVIQYLNDYSIPNATIGLSNDAAQTQDTLTKLLNAGYIIILCIDMNQVTNPPADVAYHVDKFYNTTPQWGHFFVVKGYKQMEGQFYFQIYDPYSMNFTYSDGSLMGKNRFYKSHDVFMASNTWWPNAIVVGQKGQPFHVNGLNPANIRHAYGGHLPQ